MIVMSQGPFRIHLEYLNVTSPWKPWHVFCSLFEVGYMPGGKENPLLKSIEARWLDTTK
jgi:hypothetical protein